MKNKGNPYQFLGASFREEGPLISYKREKCYDSTQYQFDSTNFGGGT